MSEKTIKKLSRRDMLKLSGTAAAGALLASCAAPTPEPTKEAMPEEEVMEEPEAKPVSGHVVVMHLLHEFTEDIVNAFHEENPGITIEVVDGTDTTRFYAMYAAGTPPDVYRIQAPQLPGLLARNLLFDSTPYFEASELIDIDDLAPANNYYKANSPLEIGEGKLYGMVKDFSPDHTIFANANHFEAAGLPVPDDTKPMTFDEVQAAAKELTVFDGDRLMQYGYGYEPTWIDRFWMNMLGETGQSLYSEGYDKIVISGNEDTMAIAKWYYDMAAEKLSPSPQNPSPSGWFGQDFVSTAASMIQYGFWFSAMALSDENADGAMMLPGSTWSGERRNPTITATGAVLIGATQVPDAAWKVFEYYHAGQPSIDRAGSGWGVPALKSQWDMIPQETDFQKQAFKVLKGELDLNTPPIQFNPFIGDTTVGSLWGKYLDQALVGDITFDEMIAGIETEANESIKEGIDRIMG